jgi:phosphate transport system permease protein
LLKNIERNMSNLTKNPYIISKNNPSHKNIIRRQKKEGRFKNFGFSAILASILFLGFLLFTIFSNGWQAFLSTKILLELNLSNQITELTEEAIESANYRKPINNYLKESFPEAKRRSEIIQLYSLISRNSYLSVKEKLRKNISSGNSNNVNLQKFEVWVPASASIDMLVKGKIEEENISDSSRVTKTQANYVKKLEEEGKVKLGLNYKFFTNGDSREAELAGAFGSIVGSFFLIAICMLCALPIGVAAAIYLEEYAPKNKLTTIIEISVNNLAAIPSIVYGLLGLALYIQFLGIPRSSALVGGLTLALLVLPIVIITTRNSIAAVPPSIKDAAIGLGASKTQVLFHHTLPLSLPGIMTGSILSISRALGETAPLLMIGMVAFVKDIPEKITDPSTALPVQIYIWSDLPEKGFAEKTSGAIIILLLFLVLANSLAVYLRKKFEYKW